VLLKLGPLNPQARYLLYQIISPRHSRVCLRDARDSILMRW
jgi:hypothetical protein